MNNNKGMGFLYIVSILAIILSIFSLLKKNDINVTIRREFGSKVSAACGQLRSNYEEDIWNMVI